ncbi:hypothetical protein ABZ714_23430 [Streptomyces sp. NPDC006798]|uniref:hypothetical protein n=1 Tax=Streptomyces sp. NPDC006798 TaxID=3155462 RepID=UPI0033FBBF4C
MRDLVPSLVTAVRALLKPCRNRPTVIVVVRPWTSPTRAEAQVILLARATATTTGTNAPPGARRLMIARNGRHFERPVAVRAARPGPARTWIP